jgi:hypothetical protein
MPVLFLSCLCFVKLGDHTNDMSTTESLNLSQEEGQPQHATTATALDVSEEDAGDTEHGLAVENGEGILLDEGVTFHDNDTGYGTIWYVGPDISGALTK